MADTRTADPDVVIEAERGKRTPTSGPTYIRYRSLSTGRRWEVNGSCDRRGDCIVGAVIAAFGGAVPRTKAELVALIQSAGGVSAVLGDLDTPVTPEFDTCCGASRFSYRVL